MAAPEIHGYAELTPIGHGGYAVVYRARQVALNRLVAVKVLGGAAADPAKLSRFRRECASIGGLSGHPHVVAVYDVGVTTDGSPYLSMEYLPGGSLADRLRREGRRPPHEVVRVGAQISDAIEVAHRAGVLHRDIKPENVLLDSAGRAKIADFGIAAAGDSDDTATGVLLGTVLHTAPEVIEGQRASVASDVYSLGSLLATLLLGRPPFAGASDDTPIPVMMRVVRDPLPDLRGAGVPDDLATVVETAMARDPSQRYPSAAALAAALREVAEAPPAPVVEERPTLPPVPRRDVAGRPAAGHRPPLAGTGFDGAATTVAEAVTPAAPAARTPPRSRRRRGGALARAGLVVGLVLLVVGAGAIVWAVQRHRHPTGPAATATTASLPDASTLPTPATDGPGPVAATEGDAEGLVAKRYPGFRVTDTAGWRDGAPVSALVAARSGDGRQQVFLFAGGHLYGRDLAEPSWHVSLIGVEHDTVTVRYGLYAARTSPPSPPIGSQVIHFHFDGTRFQPVERRIAPTATDRSDHR